MKTPKEKSIEKESSKDISKNHIEEGKPTKSKNSMNDYRKEDDGVDSIQDKPAEEQQYEKEPKKK